MLGYPSCFPCPGYYVRPAGLCQRPRWSPGSRCGAAPLEQLVLLCPLPGCQHYAASLQEEVNYWGHGMRVLHAAPRKLWWCWLAWQLLPSLPYSLPVQSHHLLVALVLVQLWGQISAGATAVPTIWDTDLTPWGCQPPCPCPYHHSHLASLPPESHETTQLTPSDPKNLSPAEL